MNHIVVNTRKYLHNRKHRYNNHNKHTRKILGGDIFPYKEKHIKHAVANYLIHGQIITEENMILRILTIMFLRLLFIDMEKNNKTIDANLIMFKPGDVGSLEMRKIPHLMGFSTTFFEKSISGGANPLTLDSMVKKYEEFIEFRNKKRIKTNYTSYSDFFFDNNGDFIFTDVENKIKAQIEKYINDNPVKSESTAKSDSNPAKSETTAKSESTAKRVIPPLLLAYRQNIVAIGNLINQRNRTLLTTITGFTNPQVRMFREYAKKILYDYTQKYVNENFKKGGVFTDKRKRELVSKFTNSVMLSLILTSVISCKNVFSGSYQDLAHPKCNLPILLLLRVGFLMFMSKTVSNVVKVANSVGEAVADSKVSKSKNELNKLSNGSLDRITDGTDRLSDNIHNEIADGADRLSDNALNIVPDLSDKSIANTIVSDLPANNLDFENAEHMTISDKIGVMKHSVVNFLNKNGNILEWIHFMISTVEHLVEHAVHGGRKSSRRNGTKARKNKRITSTRAKRQTGGLFINPETAMKIVNKKLTLFGIPANMQAFLTPAELKTPPATEIEDATLETFITSIQTPTPIVFKVPLKVLAKAFEIIKGKVVAFKNLITLNWKTNQQEIEEDDQKQTDFIEIMKNAIARAISKVFVIDIHHLYELKPIIIVCSVLKKVAKVDKVAVMKIPKQ